MTHEAHRNLALQWFAAFNEHNLEKLLSLYDDNASHYSPKLKVRQPETQGLIHKKAALRAWWQDAFTRLPSLKYEVKKIVADNDCVFMEYVRHVNGEDDLTVCEKLEIKNGVIVYSRVYHS